MKFDFIWFMVGFISGMLLDFAGSCVAARSLKRKSTGGSFRELYEDNKVERGSDDNELH